MQNDNQQAKNFLPRKKRNSLFLIILFFSISAFSQSKKIDTKKNDPKKVEAPRRQIDLPKAKRFDLKPEYSAGKSANEEPLQVQKDLVIPQRSGNMVMIQRKVLKEVGASEAQIEKATETGGDADAHHMD